MSLRRPEEINGFPISISFDDGMVVEIDAWGRSAGDRAKERDLFRPRTMKERAEQDELERELEQPRSPARSTCRIAVSTAAGQTGSRSSGKTLGLPPPHRS